MNGHAGSLRGLLYSLEKGFLAYLSNLPLDMPGRRHLQFRHGLSLSSADFGSDSRGLTVGDVTKIKFTMPSHSPQVSYSPTQRNYGFSLKLLYHMAWKVAYSSHFRKMRDGRIGKRLIRAPSIFLRDNEQVWSLL